ncbi:hypothetical protein GGE09_003244 [Roseobacter sp. N2S]|nr:hypothetical protein [Roseobacter sp. N2S]
MARAGRLSPAQNSLIGCFNEISPATLWLQGLLFYLINGSLKQGVSLVLFDFDNQHGDITINQERTIF